MCVCVCVRESDSQVGNTVGEQPLPRAASDNQPSQSPAPENLEAEQIKHHDSISMANTEV